MAALDFSEYVKRLDDRLFRQSAIGRLSQWIETHTTLGGKPFSFRGHEFQKDIVDSTSFDICAVKPAQVGLSELMARLLLSFLATADDIAAMLLFPTIHEAQRFIKSRIDPIVETSSYLKNAIATANDSASFKRIGSSQLHTGGTHGKPVISMSVDLLVVDEVSFCDQEVLVTAESRLQHSRFSDPITGSRGFKRRFSTPTTPGYGISALFEESDQHYRIVRCNHCQHEFWPNFLEHCVVDGFDDSMANLSYLDALKLDRAGKVGTARLLCPSCHNVPDLHPEHREWVAFQPGRARQGWQVSPFDLPDYHSAASLIRQLIHYREQTGHFRNFSLGLPYADATNSILDDVIEKNISVRWVPPDQAQALGVYGTVAGMDVGLVSHFVVGKWVGGQFHVLYFEKVRLGKGGEGLFERAMELLGCFGVELLVCDNQPFTDSIRRIKAARPEGWVLPNLYNLPATKFSAYDVTRDNDVSSNRTKTLDYTAKLVNSGTIQWPLHAELADVRLHLQNSKRIDRTKENGEVVSEWVKVSSEDHYFHSLNYMVVAADIQQQRNLSGWAPVPGFIEAEVGSKAEDVA